MAEGSPKRRPPTWLQEILSADEELTRKFVVWGNSLAPLHSLRKHYKALEVTCHGIPWLAFWIAFTWLFNNTHLIGLQVNMIMALILDIVLVAIAKAFFRRRRPLENKKDAFAEFGPDHFSFPSGHCSRAAMVAFIFIFLWPIPIFFHLPLLAWTTALCISRVLMQRHHLLDVIGGVVLGVIEGLLMALLWIGDSNAMWIMSFISDEKIAGAEYDV
ncbi:polyisoprenoid diphosphate/phosphate phosphohydrolase PLPP6 [Anthonomus grandis grandis]|uniref:polyisoprenoid diphosphate/phosphate phosphohydrolase PLPP6 n=1 Tax=Anthonomus grandis grandis TaxID=2921223 RepID=UPI002165A836|nr:polyisoprenoid diphosphate/phosphate phosphohydrolase PLPP6 [Anthonomus grandis grandis]